MVLETKRLRLCLQTPQQLLAWVDTLDPAIRNEIAPAWLQRLRSMKEPDPWTCAFSIDDAATKVALGTCAFKSPPDSEGAVEIAYGIEDPYQGRGFATEAARALVNYARCSEKVQIVRAHTKVENIASQRVLAKAGFSYMGLHDDPDDGLVQRWELIL